MKGFLRIDNVNTGGFIHRPTWLYKNNTILIAKGFIINTPPSPRQYSQSGARWFLFPAGP